MTPDTTALRALTHRHSLLRLTPATVRALCDGYDEAQRLRADLTMSGRAIDTYVGALAAERERFAALVADLRALRQRYGPDAVSDAYFWHYDRDLGAVIDRHAPEEGR